jgi:SNF2 family DNA or RNA helicase
MLVTFKDGFFTVQDFNSIEKIKRFGFKVHPVTRELVTKDFSTACRLSKFFDMKAKKQFDSYSVNELLHKRASVFSKAELDPYQKEAVEFALSRSHSYLALEQGLGKTVIAISVIESIMRRYPYLKVTIVVPPFLVSNWMREFERFSSYTSQVKAIRQSKDILNQTSKHFIQIVADSLLIKPQVSEYLKAHSPDLVIVDEAHRFNSIDAKRTKALYFDGGGIIKDSERVVLLSGTPMRNGPIELYPSLSRLAFKQLGFLTYRQYAFRYCAARVIQVTARKKILDVSGSSNLGELKQKTKDFFFVRRVKDLLDLKSKDILVTIDGENNKTLKALELKIIKQAKIGDIINGDSGLGEIARYRKEISKLKTSPGIEFIESLLENKEKSVLVFGHHREMLEDIHHHFLKIGSGLIYGGVKNKERDEIEEDFQSGKIRVIVANVAAMVGLNLTRADYCVFAESSWVPADNDQAKKRAIRRGQLKKVFIYHLALANTLDEVVLRKVLKKEEVINEFINTKTRGKK